jgi:hypothetical protein
MQTLDNLKEQITISKQIDILMAQTLKLMDIVNENQKQVNDLKADQDKLKSAIKGQQTADNISEVA